LGTNGANEGIPLLGDFQELGAAFRRRMSWFCAGSSAPLAVYAAVLAAVATTLGTTLALKGYVFGDLWVIAALALAAAAAERGTVRLSSSIEVSITVLPTLFAAVVFGPLAAMVVCAASMLGDFRPFLKWAIYTSSRAITGAATALVAIFAVRLTGNGFGAIAAATVAGAATCEVMDIFFVSLTVRLRGKSSMREGARTLLPVLAGSLPLFAPVVTLLAFAYETISPWTLPLFLAPAFAAQRLSILYQEQRRMSEDLSAANKQLERANLSFATALVATLDARDQYTAGHSAAVAIYARDIAARMGLDEARQRLAHLCGLVHDIGKVGLPAGLLEKPGPLTLDERRLMEQHAAIGERILANVESYAEIASIVRHHHERVDGNGYPDKLIQDEIPLISRIIAVADAYDAMTSNRPYREAMPSRVARLRLAQAVDTQFDTAAVAAFEAILAGATEAYRSRASDDFRFDLQRKAHSDLSPITAQSAA
jgi:putative nucleotidyltransferase with HDIG domain